MDYPLEITSVGSDSYIVMSKGHHDLKVFMDKAKKEYPDWMLGGAIHKWCKVIPDKSGKFNSIFAFVDKTGRGAFPVTYCYEYGDT